MVNNAKNFVLQSRLALLKLIPDNPEIIYVWSEIKTKRFWILIFSSVFVVDSSIAF